jgi:histidinol-phosphate/aromatic aminotransferase/cobyric acid decarboxylase-like protein
MKRRRFLQLGAMASTAPAVLPLAPRGLEAALTGSSVSSGSQELIRLSNNENPLGMAQVAKDAILNGMLRHTNEYSFPARTPVIEAIARKHGTTADAVVLGNGSTEVNQMGVQFMMAPNYRLVAPRPTYEDVTRYSQPLGAELVTFPLTSDWAHDLERRFVRAAEHHIARWRRAHVILWILSARAWGSKTFFQSG